MTVQWWEYPSSFMVLAGLISCATALLRNGLASRWPWLFSYLLFDSAYSVACLFLVSRGELYAWYFYVYWAGQVLRGLLGLGVLYDVIDGIPLANKVPANVRAMVFTFAVTVTVGCVILATSSTPHPHQAPITTVALSLTRCIAIAWGSFAASLFLGVAVMGLAWTPLPLRLAAGFSFQIIVAIVVAYASTLHPHNGAKFQVAAELVNTLVLFYWSGSFSQAHTYQPHHSSWAGVIFSLRSEFQQEKDAAA